MIQTLNLVSLKSAECESSKMFHSKRDKIFKLITPSPIFIHRIYKRRY